MTLDFQSRALLNLDLPAWAYTTDGVQLLVDGDMEAAGTASWGPIGAGCVLTKETGTPHSGSQCLRVASTAMAIALAKPLPAPTIVGGTYRVRGWARGDGARNPTVMDYDAATLWTGTSANTWQYFDVTYTAIRAQGPCLWQATGAVGYVEFDDITLEWLPASTRNLGTLGGYAQLGNGYTAAGFPTQLAPTHGMSFSGAVTQYLQVANSGVFNFTAGGGVDQPFSLEVLTNCAFSPAAYTNLISSIPTGVTGGWSLVANIRSFYLANSDAGGDNFYTLTGANILCPGVMSHIVATYDGSGVSTGQLLFLNGRQCAVTRSATGVYNGLPALNSPVQLGRGGASAYTCWNFAIYPFALQPGEISQLYRLRLGLLNQGAG